MRLVNKTAPKVACSSRFSKFLRIMTTKLRAIKSLRQKTLRTIVNPFVAAKKSANPALWTKRSFFVWEKILQS
ncbi:MAG: hypothetical protein GX561_10900 [Lentisphaerae bacterium]|jgi:hypothetical protein|nr:hypothetical protein [Lentisphaerota bacterium]